MYENIPAFQQQAPSQAQPQMSTAPKETPKRKNGKVSFKKLSKVLLVLVFLASVGSAVYFFIQYRDLAEKSGVNSAAEVQDMVDRVGKLMKLPDNETPTLATVLDKEKLKDQEFFSGSQNGDKILVYVAAKKAILYRPSENRIIEVSPVVMQNYTYKAGVLNASGDANKVKNVANTLSSKNADVQLIDSGKALVTGYTENLVVDLTGKQAEKVKEIAANIGGQVSTLPAGETKPENVDFVIIVVK